MRGKKGFRLFSGSANEKLARKIAGRLGVNLGKLEVGRFADGEVDVWIKEKVSGFDCLIIQPTSPPVNDNLIELLLIADSLRRSGAASIFALIPYFGYARKHHQSRPGEPVSAEVVAQFLESVGIKGVITCDLHSQSVVDFFKIPVENLSPLSIFAQRLKRENLENAVVVAADDGAIKQASSLARELNVPKAVVVKHRFINRHDQCEVRKIKGKVRDKTCILIDDMISTGGTVLKVATFLRKNKAKNVWVCATHAVFNDKTYPNLAKAWIEKLFVTDTVPLKKKVKNLEVLSTAELFSKSLEEISKP